jgi:hypothetical protein
VRFADSVFIRIVVAERLRRATVAIQLLTGGLRTKSFSYIYNIYLTKTSIKYYREFTIYCLCLVCGGSVSEEDSTPP